MASKMEMELFLRELLMETENEQSKVIRSLEEERREIESLQREREVIEDRLKDNISFFSPAGATEKDKLAGIQEQILVGHGKTERMNESLNQLNKKMAIMGDIIQFIQENGN